MLFAHAPAGFLAAYLSRKFWAHSNKFSTPPPFFVKGRGRSNNNASNADKNILRAERSAVEKLSKKQTNLLYILGAAFGVFPDIDTIYFYFIDASFRHREFITHSFLIYVVIFAILYAIARIIKNNFLKSFSLVIFLSILSHLLADSLTSGIMWFYPFSRLTYGLLNFDFLAQSFFGKYIFFIDMFLEIMIILAVVCIVLHKFFKKYLKIGLAISYAILALVIVLLYFLWPHSYAGRPAFYYKDQDRDGIINMRDLDLDGDGKPNIKDKDADGDGQKNIDQILASAQKIEGVWHDKLEGGLAEMPARFGLLSKVDVVRKSYEEAGIFFRREMAEDFKKHSYAYLGTPRDALFDRKIYNLYIFFKNNGMLKDGKENIDEGDVIFWGKNSESVDNVGLVIFRKRGVKTKVLIMEEKKANIRLFQDLLKELGAPIAAARI